jgi:hypothetical protein
MKALRHFVKHDGLVFHSKNNGTLAETTILTQGLHPAVKALRLPKAGMHAFRRGCNRRWELARISSAVIRQQMGHATADMTALYTGEIPVEQVTKHFQLEPNGAAVTASSGSFVGAGDGNRTHVRSLGSCRQDYRSLGRTIGIMPGPISGITTPRCGRGISTTMTLTPLSASGTRLFCHGLPSARSASSTAARMSPFSARRANSSAIASVQVRQAASPGTNRAGWRVLESRNNAQKQTIDAPTSGAYEKPA